MSKKYHEFYLLLSFLKQNYSYWQQINLNKKNLGLIIFTVWLLKGFLEPDRFEIM